MANQATSRPRGYAGKVSAVGRQRLYRPSHLRAYIRDALGLREPGTDREKALDEVMGWLARAQDAGEGGVAGYFSFGSGWRAPYPETTGYIIPTMFDYARAEEHRDFRDRAIRAADWILTVQLATGAFPGGFTDREPHPIVFNTGQILQGLVRAYEETADEKYLRAAEAAGDWLTHTQDSDGAWRKSTYRNQPHTYHTRVAWPLLQLNQICPKASYVQAAEKHLHWAMSNQLPNGWFQQNALYLERDSALTHSLAYAIRGLLESGLLLSNQDFISSAKKASAVLLEQFQTTGALQASYDKDWASSDNYACVTGNAQLAGIWLRLYETEHDPQHRDAGFKMSARLVEMQNVSSTNDGIRGGVKGSNPISGGYMSYCYLNWAAKFFADLLMLERQIRSLSEGAGEGG